MKRLLPVIILILVLLEPVMAQQRRDSVYTASERFKPTKLILPGALMTAGVVATVSPWYQRNVNLPVKDWANGINRQWGGAPELSHFTFDNYLQYAPYLGYGVGFALGAGEHGRVEQAMAMATAVIIGAALSRSIKYLASVERPNGYDYFSFPSGHTTTVFLAAEMVRLEFGPWWGLAAYSTAFVTAFMRLVNNYHWTSDLMGGAAIGIFSANAAYWLLPAERKLFHVNSKVESKLQASALPFVAPTPAGSCYGLSLSFLF